MIVGVFCRVNHPAGYGGFPDVPPDALAGLREDFYKTQRGQRGELRSGAHGYVTLVVQCANMTELAAVETRLKFWFRWADRDDLWYGGTFDLVSSVEVPGALPATDGPEWRSKGDNRAVALISAAYVLDRPL